MDSSDSPKTEPQLEGSQDTHDAGTELLDLAYLRDLLGILRDMDVAGFSAGGLSVTFQDKPEVENYGPSNGRTPEQIRVDENRSTSSRPVSGFDFPKDGWRNPSLWPTQAGRVLKLDGSYED